jgi:hypothetical protein
MSALDDFARTEQSYIALRRQYCELLITLAGERHLREDAEKSLEVLYQLVMR